METTTHKKRGRKPKNKIVTNTDPSFEMDGIENHLIVNIKQSPKVSHDNIPGYDQSDIIHESIESFTSASLCWNCSNNLHVSYSIPYQRDKDVFMVMGHFCSYECGARYLYDNFENIQLWNRYTLLNAYVNYTNHTHNIQVKMSPP